MILLSFKQAQIELNCYYCVGGYEDIKGKKKGELPQGKGGGGETTKLQTQTIYDDDD